MPDFWVLVPNNYQSTCTTSVSTPWYQNQPNPFLMIASENQTGPLYNVIVTQSTMFTPTGYGILYYHAIPQTISVTSHVPYPYVPISARRPLTKPALLRGRRALRRSIDLFRMLRPADEVRAFLAGDPVIIHGRRYDYRVQKRDNLLRHTMRPDVGHIPYDLQLLDKTGRSLARGCTVIRDTPVIDQLVALILHIEHDESVVLKNTNWSPPLLVNLAQAA